MNTCDSADLICQFFEWIIQNIEISISVVVGISVVYWIYLLGHTAGQKEGFINGVMHYIHLKAYDDADFPEAYKKDKYVQIAQQQLAKKIKPKLPSDL